MNEKIKELALQAGGSHYPDVGGKTLEKFSELLVRECYDTIKKDMELAHIQLIPIDFGIYANGRLRRIIKEHFGVE